MFNDCLYYYWQVDTVTRFGNETSRSDDEDKILKQLKEENIELKNRLKYSFIMLDSC